MATLCYGSSLYYNSSSCLIRPGTGTAKLSSPPSSVTSLTYSRPSAAVALPSLQHTVPENATSLNASRDISILAVETRIFPTLLHVYNHPALVQRPLIVRDVTTRAWEVFRERYAEHPAFKGSKWEYDGLKQKIITVPLSKPLHDIAIKVMIDHVHYGMADVQLDTRARIRALRIDRENFEKLTPSGALNQREPDCALWTLSYESGIIPTLVWEVGHSQKRSSLFRRAKMWCRRYDGKVRVVILVKYLRKDPRRDNASILMVYRPRRREDGKWTAEQQGAVNVLFPRPLGAGYENPDDVVPLTYEDYFGAGNVGGPDPVTGGPIDPHRRFDLPLELVREMILEVVAATIGREGFRYASGGSSVGGNMPVEDAAEDPVEAPEEEGEQESPAEEIEYEQYGDDWDAAMSDVSDAP